MINENEIAQALAILPEWSTYQKRESLFFLAGLEYHLPKVNLEGDPLTSAVRVMQYFKRYGDYKPSHPLALFLETIIHNRNRYIKPLEILGSALASVRGKST